MYTGILFESHDEDGFVTDAESKADPKEKLRYEVIQESARS